MVELGPAYLIHGDDHGAIAERRARLRALAEAQGDATSVELLEGEQATPTTLAATLSAMTLALGRRVIVVEGVERWKQADVQKELSPVFAALPPDTTVALFAREDGRVKAPAALHEAVTQAGGQIVAESAVKPWELPKWVRQQAAGLGLALDAAAAKALLAQVGERQQRLLRELEKLALEGASEGARSDAATGSATATGSRGVESGPVRITAEDVEQRAARSAERRVYALADALVAADMPHALRTYLAVRQQGERLPGLTYLMASRLREGLAVSLRLRAGESPAQIKRSLRMPARAAERFLADVARSEPERLRAALVVLADLEVDTRGGDLLRAHRAARASLHEETLAVGALRAMTRG